MAGVMVQGNWSYFVQKDLSEHFAVSYGEFSSMIGALFTTVTPDQAIYYEALEGDLGSVPLFEGEIAYGDAKQSYRLSTEEIEYAYGIKVTKKFRRSDLYGVVQRKVRALADRFRSKKEAIAASAFNNSFTSFKTADTVALFSASHTSDVGGSTQGNYGTSQFSAANVEATRRLIIKFKTNTDNIMTLFPDLLLVETTNEEKAFELIKSKGKVDTSINNPNFHEGKYKVAVWHNYLTSAYPWFFMNEKMMREYMKFLEWNPVEFFYAGEMDTITSKHAGYMSNNVSCADWRWGYGHKATT